LRLRGDSIVGLGLTIEDSEQIGDLASIWSRLAIVARALLADGTEAREIAAIVSKEIRAATARTAVISEQSLASAGRGKAPASYALLVLGSAGRGESLFAMDQDNAIVFADDESGYAVDPWFEALGEKLNAILDQAGVPYCRGGVMAKNSSWRRSVNGWRDEVGRWLSRSSTADILNADIFFDAVPVHGDIEIGERLRVNAIDAASRAPTFLKLMAVEAVRVEPATGWFGRLRLNEAGRLDLKRHGVFPIVAAARARALSFGIRDRSTSARLTALRDLEEVPQDTITSLMEAHGVFLEAILRQQLRDIDLGIPPSNHVLPAELSPLEIEQLKWALRMVPLIANLLGDPVSGA
jgi:DNA polymerase-3 subunit epsilon/CBS domain-containing protein